MQHAHLQQSWHCAEPDSCCALENLATRQFCSILTVVPQILREGRLREHRAALPQRPWLGSHRHTDNGAYVSLKQPRLLPSKTDLKTVQLSLIQDPGGTTQPKSGPGRQSPPADAFSHHTGGGFSSSNRRGTGRLHDQEARAENSCNSTGPPVSRGRFVACWWARFTVESTDTSHSITPASSASTSSRVKIRSEVPSPQKRRCRFHTVFHEPNPSGRSRHGIPARYR